mmetsp:Transcript_22492/g.76444  ORF Transcript_22492/g.76444 Transcript_22492/m.76444 type:complete len:327 (-) Transcript_22492:1545-2525(-)
MPASYITWASRMLSSAASTRNLTCCTRRSGKPFSLSDASSITFFSSNSFSKSADSSSSVFWSSCSRSASSKGPWSSWGGTLGSSTGSAVAVRFLDDSLTERRRPRLVDLRITERRRSWPRRSTERETCCFASASRPCTRDSSATCTSSSHDSSARVTVSTANSSYTATCSAALKIRSWTDSTASRLPLSPLAFVPRADGGGRDASALSTATASSSCLENSLLSSVTAASSSPSGWSLPCSASVAARSTSAASDCSSERFAASSGSRSPGLLRNFAAVAERRSSATLRCLVSSSRACTRPLPASAAAPRRSRTSRVSSAHSFLSDPQ